MSFRALVYTKYLEQSEVNDINEHRYDVEKHQHKIDRLLKKESFSVDADSKAPDNPTNCLVFYDRLTNLYFIAKYKHDHVMDEKERGNIFSQTPRGSS